MEQMVRKPPRFRSEEKKRTTSGHSQQFPNGFSAKLLLHLNFNRNFRISWLNGKHPFSHILFHAAEKPKKPKKHKQKKHKTETQKRKTTG